MVVWYDDLLPISESENQRLLLPIKKKYSSVPSSNRGRISYKGKTQKMKCGLNATVIEDNGYYDITIEFEDGLVRHHCRRDKFNEGSIAHIEK